LAIQRNGWDEENLSPDYPNKLIPAKFLDLIKNINIFLNQRPKNLDQGNAISSFALQAQSFSWLTPRPIFLT